MDIQILQELKPYSKYELENIFSLEENKLNTVLKSLSMMNILKKISSDISEIELEELLEIDKLSIKIESNMYVFKYVGMIVIDKICLIIYPKYIKNYLDDKNNGYVLFKQIIAVIKKYQSKEQKQGINDNEEIENFNLLSIAIELLINYLEYGLYQNDKHIIEQNGDGEILWDKTINESSMYFSNAIPIYLDVFTTNQENNEQDYFRRLHASIITEVCNELKDILDIVDISSFNISFEKIKNFGNKQYILHRLNQELSNQFITYKQEVLKIMKRYILKENSKNISENISFVGTNSFNLVWEDVCSVVMKDCINKSIKELGLNYSIDDRQSILLADVIDKPKWQHRESKNIYQASKTLIPDIVTINKEEKTLSIYDAKYYKIILNDKELKNQPGVSDVTKQYLYELAYRDFANENELSILENAFLIPSDGNEEIILGSVSMDIFKDIVKNDIKVILKPCYEMYKKYLEY